MTKKFTKQNELSLVELVIVKAFRVEERVGGRISILDHFD
jgi:hypothetical protein